LQRIAGNKNFAVNGNNIINTADKITSQSTLNGASGSVYIKGKAITELNFDIYVRGDGDKRTSAPNYLLTTGDAFSLVCPVWTLIVMSPWLKNNV
jgi:hypothetical protein